MKTRTNRLLALLALTMVMCLFALPAMAYEATVTWTTKPTQDLPGTSDELFAAYVEQALYEPIYGGVAMWGTQARDLLDTQNQLIYDALKVMIEDVANGERTSTVFTLATSEIAGLKATYTAEELGTEIVVNGAISQAAQNALSSKIMDTDAVFDALLHDCPLDLYWFDKSTSGAMSSSLSLSGNSEQLSATSIKVTMQVVRDYQNGNSTTAKTADMATVLANAQAIVNANASKTDAQKLEAYRAAICDLVSYNHDAASDSYTGGYGNPWQIIYVFDGKEDTNVVCEGYSKAFQYLCDLSTFSDACCITVSGVMAGGTGAGRHMWNVVTLGGVNYMVDVTNSDTDSVGDSALFDEDPLFLSQPSSGSGTYADTYTFIAPSVEIDENTATKEATITYTYDDGLDDEWGQDALTLGKATTNVASITSGSTVTNYTDFESALAAWGNGATLTLLTDVDYDQDILLSSGTHTLDLDGFTLDLGTGIIDNNGTLTISGGMITSDVEGAAVVQNDGTLTISSCSITGETVAVDNYGQLTLENCKLSGSIGFNNQEGGAAEFTGCEVADVYVYGGSLTMTDCTLTAEYKYIAYRGGTITLKGDSCAGWRIGNLGNATATVGAEIILPQNYYLFDYNSKVMSNLAYLDSGTITKHTSTDHVVAYAADMSTATITASCDKCGAAMGKLTLEAPANLIYDGAAKAVIVEDTTGAAYTLRYAGMETTPVDAGDYSAILSIGDVGVTVDFTIVPREISITAATIADVIYNANGGYTFTVTNVTFDNLNETLTLGTDYTAEATLTGKNEIGSGVAAEVTVTMLNSNYTLKSSTFDATVNLVEHAHNWTYTGDNSTMSILAECCGEGVCPIPGGQAVYMLTVDDFTYDGQEHGASFVIMQNDYKTVVTDPLSYELSVGGLTYSIKSDNAELGENGSPLNAGTYAVYLMAASAKIEAELTISQKELPAPEALVAVTYTGAEQKPVPVVKDGDKTLVEGTDYTVDYLTECDWIDAGVYEYSVNGVGNYKGVQTAEYTINPADIAAAQIKVADQVYTGAPLAPDITVTWNGMTLEPGTDYTYTYSNNTNVGTAQIPVNGIGNFTGETTGTFAITKSGSAITAEADASDYTYGDTITITAKAAATGEAPAVSVFGLLRAAQPTMTLYYGTEKLCDGVTANENGEYVMTYDTAEKTLPIGTSTLKVGYSGDTNTAAQETTVEVALVEKELTAALGGSAEKTYDATKAVTDIKDLTITLSGVLTSDSVAASAQYAYDNANAGTGKTVTASGLALTGADTLWYKLAATEATANIGAITKAALQVSGSGTASSTFSSELTVSGLTVTLAGGTPVPGTWTVEGSDKLPITTTSATAVFTPANGADNYVLPLEAEVAVSISAKPVEGATVTLTPNTFTYDGTEKKPAVSVMYGGTALIEGTDFDVVYPQDATNVGHKTVEVVFKGSYSGNAYAPYSILQAGAEFVGGLGVFNGTTQTTEFTYGDTITVLAQPGVQRPVVMSLRPMEKNQMALFVGDTQISDAVDPDDLGVYTMTYDTAGKALAAGSNVITARFAGNDNLLQADMSATVNLVPKALTITSVTAKDRVYNSDVFTVAIESAVFDGKIVDTDDVQIAAGLLGTLESDQIGAYAKLTLPESITLTGAHAAYYTAAGGAEAATEVNITDVPEDLETKVEVTEGIKEIPQELADAGFDTREKIRLQLKTVISALEPTVADTALYDATLMYSEDGGLTWIKADKEHFPASGLLHVMLPVPKDSDPDKHQYFVTHMFTMDAYGHKPGETETPDVAVVLGEDGKAYLSFYVTGLSPIMVGWSVKEIPANLPQTGDSSNIAMWLALLSLTGVSLLLLRRRARN